MVKLFIDPGHGGTDPGAVGNSLQEKNLTLQIAAAMQEILIEEYENIEIRLSRSGDETLSLSARTNAANRWDADYFVPFILTLAAEQASSLLFIQVLEDQLQHIRTISMKTF